MTVACGAYFRQKAVSLFRDGGLETCSPGHCVSLINLIEYDLLTKGKVQTCENLCFYVHDCVHLTKCIGGKCTLKIIIKIVQIQMSKTCLQVYFSYMLQINLLPSFLILIWL